MPKVRLLADGAGRYDVRKGELFVCTDEEFSRWAPAGVVEPASKKDAVVAEEEPVAVVGAEAEEEPVAVVTKRRSTRKPASG